MQLLRGANVVSVAAQKHFQRLNKLAAMQGVVGQKIAQHIVGKPLELRMVDKMQQQPFDTDLFIVRGPPAAEEALTDCKSLARFVMRVQKLTRTCHKATDTGRDSKQGQGFGKIDSSLFDLVSRGI